MDVHVLLEAEAALHSLPDNEQDAMHHALDKLEALGDQLPWPHSSHVEGFRTLRELRPRQGRSPWRAFYRRIGSVMVIAAIGPEAQVDNRGFRHAAGLAQDRLDRFL